MVENQHLVNIAKAIEKGTRVTTLDELKAKGQNQIKVINAAKIMELIREAVDLAIESMTGVKVGAEREKLQAAAKKEFDDLLRKYQDTQKSKGEIEGQASQMQNEIDAIQKLLAGGGGGAAAQMGLAGISGQISGLVQKLQASEKARIDSGLHEQKMEKELAEMKARLAAAEAEKSAAMDTGRGMAQAVDSAYAKIDAGLGMKAREMGINFGSEPRTPEEKMQRLAQIAEAAVQGLEKERNEKVEAKRALAETQAKKEAIERELAQTKESRQSLERRLDEQSEQINKVAQEKGQVAREAERLEQKAGDQGAQIARLQADLTAAQQALTATRNDLAMTQAKKAVLEGELTATSGGKSTAEKDLMATRQGKVEAEQKLAQTQSAKQQVEQQLAQTQSAKQAVEQKLAQTEARKAVSEKELGELQEFKKKLEEKVDEQGTQYAEVHQMMAQIGKRADDLIHEVEHGRLKHLKPEEKKIILDAMHDVKDQVKKLQEERAFLEKKLFYMSMTIDSLEAELLAAKGLTPSMAGSVVKDDGLQITFDEAGVASM